MAYLIPENLRTRRDVPPAVGTVARILAEHLDFGATVWYEPLFSIDDRHPDLVVLVPDTGVLVLQVLQTKRTAIVDVSGSTLTVKDENGQRVEVQHPLARAQTFVDQIRQQVLATGIAADDELPVMAAGVFGYIDRRAAHDRGLDVAIDTGRCLFRDDIDRMSEGPDGARKVLAELLSAPPRSVISDEAERLYRAVIHPDTVLTSIQGELPGITAAIRGDVKALDREQEALAKTIGSGHRVIRGVAGSGKTVILVHRARLLAQIHPRDRILVTCYNRSLQGYLARQLEPYRNVTVSTVHRQLGKVLAMAGQPVRDPTTDDSVGDTSRRALDALDSLQSRGANYESQLFDHVLVDEAQDLPVNALRFAVRMLRRGSDSLLIVADAAQSIYGKGFTWKDAGIEAAGRTRVLRRNYRNTRQILDFAWSFLSRELSLGVDLDDGGSTEVVVPPEASMRNGVLPIVRHLPSRDAEVHTIASLVKQWLDEGVPAGDIAVLYGSRFAGGGFHWIDKLEVAFERVKVPWYWPTDPNQQSGKTTVGASRDQVLVSTIHSAKGLEFPRVILCAYLEEKPPEEMAASRRLIYVGMTRAVDRLVLTASGSHRFIADLERGPAAN